MLARILASLLILGFSSFSSAKTVIISDLDDTIKYTHVASFTKFFHGLFDDHAFLGMPELVMGLKAASGVDAKLVIVSGSPKFIRSNIESMLKANNISPDHLVIAGQTSLKPAKLRLVVEKLVEPGDDVILLGDSEESDPQFYLDLRNQFPNTKFRIYIHQVSDAVMPAGVTAFSTPIQVAYDENQIGLAINIANSMLSQMTDDEYENLEILRYHFPEWKPCLSKSDFLISVSAMANSVSDGPLVNAYYERLIEPTCSNAF